MSEDTDKKPDIQQSNGQQPAGEKSFTGNLVAKEIKLAILGKSQVMKGGIAKRFGRKGTTLSFIQSSVVLTKPAPVQKPPAEAEKPSPIIRPRKGRTLQPFPFVMSDKELRQCVRWARNQGDYKLRDLTRVFQNLIDYGPGAWAKNKFADELSLIVRNPGCTSQIKAIFNAGGDPDSYNGNLFINAIDEQATGNVRAFLAAGVDAFVVTAADLMYLRKNGYAKLALEILHARARPSPVAKLQPPKITL